MEKDFGMGGEGVQVITHFLGFLEILILSYFGSNVEMTHRLLKNKRSKVGEIFL
jgi:hypothetical protein